MAAKRKGNTLNIINGFFGEQIEVDKSIYSNEKLYENVTGKNYIPSLRKVKVKKSKIQFLMILSLKLIKHRTITLTKKER
jgi:hypothetical protein